MDMKQEFQEDLLNPVDIEKMFQKMFQKPPSDSLVDRLKSLMHLKVTIEDTEGELKQMKNGYESLEADIFMQMLDSGVQSMSVDGHTIYRNTRMYASISPEQKEAGHLWLNDNGYDHLLKLTVNSNTLSAEMKTRMEEQGMDSVPACINITTKNKLGIRR